VLGETAELQPELGLASVEMVARVVLGALQPEVAEQEEPKVQPEQVVQPEPQGLLPQPAPAQTKVGKVGGRKSSANCSKVINSNASDKHTKWS